MEHVRKQKGFTLIEMIIAVAILAVAGVVIVSLFVSAHVKNQKSIDLDQSVSQCTAFIEQLKASQDIEALSNKGFMEAAVSTGMSEKGSFVIYYDKNWARIAKQEHSDTIPADAEYAISLELHEFPEQQGLINVDVKSVKLKPYPLEKTRQTEIFKISSVIEAIPEGVVP